MANAIRKCSIENCDKPIHARKRCATHYYHWKLENNPPCQIEGCKDTSLARQLCPSHYRKWQRGELAETSRHGVATCRIDGCEKPRHGKGYCSGHYHRITRHGHPEGGASPRFRDIEQSFLSRIKPGLNGCIEWTGADNGMGYGNMKRGDKWVLAHRYAWEREHGPIPKGKVIDHMCYNPRCVNVKHLRTVTQKQNTENYSGLSSSNTSGVRGVYWSKANKKWVGQVTHHGVRHSAGYYDCIKAAEDAVVALRNELHTHNTIDRIA